MKKAKFLFLLCVCLFLTVSSWSCGNRAATDPGDPNEVAVLDTNYGRIVMEFYPKEAPRSVANFKSLARQNFYDGTKFHRLVRDSSTFVAIQGGDPNSINGDPSTWGTGQPNQPTVPAEFSPGLKHTRGAVSMARRGNDLNSATSQFFICVSDRPAWDGQYSVFGKVIEGMNVVDTIVRAPLAPGTDRPVDPVVVNHVSIIKRDQLKQ